MSSWLVLALVLAAVPAAGGEWPQLRGSDEGHSDAHGLPLHWSEEQNVAWKTALPGRGFSSPVVLGGQVWMTTALEEEHSLRALAVDAETGKLLIDVEVFRPESFQASHPENSYASPTPVIEVGKVYVHFGAYGTACLDTSDGRVLWRNTRFVIDHEVGPGSSPILWRDLLIVNFDGTDQRFVAAFDKTTGEVRWKALRSLPLMETKKPPHRKAFSTPIVVSDGGRDLLISSGADQVSAYDPATGKEVWRVRYDGYSVVPQPVAGLGRVFVDTGYVRPHLFAIRLGGEGDVTDSHVEWTYHWQVPANPTPLLYGERLFMVSDHGRATWLDALRGEAVWQERLGGRFWASPLTAEGRIYAFASDGTTIVLEAGDTYRELARNVLDAEVRTTPAIAGPAIYLRSTTHLYRIEEGGGHEFEELVRMPPGST